MHYGIRNGMFNLNFTMTNKVHSFPIKSVFLRDRGLGCVEIKWIIKSKKCCGKMASFGDVLL